MRKFSLDQKIIKITSAVLFYWLVSICMVFLSKTLLAYGDLNVPISMTISQFTISTVLIIFAYYCVNQRRDESYVKGGSGRNTSLVLQFKDTLFLAFLLSGMIAFNNLALYFISISFYNVARSMNTVFNVIFTKLILKDEISLKVLGCCLIIFCGFMMGCADCYVSDTTEIYITSKSIMLKGIVFGVLGSLFNSLYSVISKQMLQKYTNLQVMLTLNPTALVLITPLIFINNEVDLLRATEKHVWLSPCLYTLIVLSGICGMMVTYASLLQIEVTSPLTHNVSSTSKSYVLTIIAVLVHKEFNHTTYFWLSNALVLSGSLLYASVRHSELKNSM